MGSRSEDDASGQLCSRPSLKYGSRCRMSDKFVRDYEASECVEDYGVSAYT